MRDSIRSLIEEDRLLTLFQPILSISGKKIFGLEALSRGLALDGSIVPPLELFYKAEEILSHIEKLIHHTPAESWKERLLGSPWLSLRLEAIYFLDMRGRQIGETIMLQETRSFFEPAQPESDHSLKEYFYLTKTALEKAHLTKRYISLASGNICRTYAKRVGKEEEEMIVCIDFREREGEETI